MKYQREESFLIQFSLVIRIDLGLLKWLKEIRFYEKKKEIIIKTWNFEQQESWYWVTEKLILRISRGKRRSFSTHEVGRKMVFPYYLGNLNDVLRNEKAIFHFSKKKKPKGGIFFSMEYHFYWSLGGPCFEFFKDGNDGLFEPKSSWQYDI